MLNIKRWQLKNNQSVLFCKSQEKSNVHSTKKINNLITNGSKVAIERKSNCIGEND